MCHPVCFALRSHSMWTTRTATSSAAVTSASFRALELTANINYASRLVWTREGRNPLVARLTDEAQNIPVTQTYLRQSQPNLPLMTAEHVGRSEPTAEPSPWLTVTGSCRLPPRSPPAPRAAGTRATAGWELPHRAGAGAWPWGGGRAAALRELNSKREARWQRRLGRQLSATVIGIHFYGSATIHPSGP